MKSLRDSRYFEPLLKKYVRSPSIVLCRVPELELLSSIELRHPVLDHCCGDGFVSGMAFPDVVLDAGIDINRKQLDTAQDYGNYQEIQWADAGLEIPYPEKTFATVVNNSGIEHIPDLNSAIYEIARVLKPGGWVFINVLNSRYFERWPLPTKTANSYRKFQPFYHALNENGWRNILERHRMFEVTFVDYFNKDVSMMLAELDYRYSAFYFKKSFSMSVLMEVFLPTAILRKKWRSKLGSLTWSAEPGQGSGFMIAAKKR